MSTEEMDGKKNIWKYVFQYKYIKIKIDYMIFLSVNLFTYINQSRLLWKNFKYKILIIFHQFATYTFLCTFNGARVYVCNSIENE